MVYDCGFIASPSVCRILYEFAFPWIFCFAIFFGLLLRAKIFGPSEDKTARGVSGIIGLVAGFLIVMAYGSTMGAFLAGITAGTVMYLTVIMGLILVITIVKPEWIEKFEGKSAWALIIGLVVITWMIINGVVGGMNWFYFGLTQDLIALIIIFIVIGAMMWFINNTETKPTPPAGKKQGEV
ncbi:MAG: hypothetical protein KAT28_00970 [Candidatus Aenigmarchaeota archaeon]|nr:hypothetical protein [Candidatus Aenigmarchaeota archaeon]